MRPIDALQGLFPRRQFFPPHRAGGRSRIRVLCDAGREKHLWGETKRILLGGSEAGAGHPSVRGVHFTSPVASQRAPEVVKAEAQSTEIN